MTEIDMIVAYDRNRLIGRDGDMPWGRDLPADLQHVKEVTMGASLIMGRKTFESLPGLLPGRQSIVISRSMPDQGDISVVRSLHDAFEAVEREKVFVFGGTEVYTQALGYVARVYATEVRSEFDDPTRKGSYFPELSADEWQEVQRESHTSDDRNAYDYDFVIYDRKNSK